MLTHLDLFSGIGGFALGFQRDGFRTIAFCEIDDYAQRTLQKNFGALKEKDRPLGKRTTAKLYRGRFLADTEPSERGPQHSQRREVQRRNDADGLQEREEASGGPESCSANVSNPTSRARQRPASGQIRHAAFSDQTPRIFSDIRILDGAQFRGVTVLTAGVPCQPASQAGKRRGTADDRWLWPEALRILRESLPAWAIFENPPGILTLEGGLVFERLLAAMESEGYAVQPIIIPACAVDAKHRRDRVWIVGHQTGTDADRGNGHGRSGVMQMGRERSAGQDAEGNGTHSRRELLERREGEPAQGATEWDAEPGVGRVAHGVPHRVDRLRGLGNAVVPQVVQVIARHIRKIETSP